MAKNDYERGFADGYQRGFQDGKKAAGVTYIPTPYPVPYYPYHPPQHYPYFNPYFTTSGGNCQGVGIGQCQNAGAAFNGITYAPESN